MRCCGARCLLLVAVAVAGLAYIAYVPVPDDFDNPWEIRPIIWSTKLGPYLFWLGEKLGYGTELEQLRALFEKMGDMVPPDPNSSVKMTETEFDGVKVRLYEPMSRAEKPTGAFVFYHGGGWSVGSARAYDYHTRSIAEKLNIVVVSVDFRLAPEHKFPAALDDCTAATLHLLRNAAQYNVDPNRVAIGGDSAGGNLAATVSLKLRDMKASLRPVLQLLIYPNVQSLDLWSPSSQQNEKQNLYLGRKWMAIFKMAYALGRDGNDAIREMLFQNQHLSAKTFAKYHRYLDYVRLLDRDSIPEDFENQSTRSRPLKEPISAEFEDTITNSYFSPLLAATLREVPPACLFTAEYDPLRDEGFLYKRRLEDASVPVTHLHYIPAWHGFFSTPHRNTDIYKRLMRDICDCLSKGLKL
ncbi:arylacetamide deacetylase-like isoform X1 [Lingula anatina]|uniref:Arylacetamide deacetylase-like isoform X1 n=1 Tax=Lingula anatina TaxID=7574 RepID=A0A1S3K4K3_LINAN|nr:arylacetamide deacetylase-like isoform X1 [Lingula anatina]|eukprot:XP_013417560.1 arylacetamide deacetylase-like isoform X1 [Lingula anatina]